jgi:hypothetical protein
MPLLGTHGEEHALQGSSFDPNGEPHAAHLCDGANAYGQWHQAITTAQQPDALQRINSTNSTASGAQQTQPAQGVTQTETISGKAYGIARAKNALTHNGDTAVTVAYAHRGERK